MVVMVMSQHVQSLPCTALIGSVVAMPVVSGADMLMYWAGLSH